MDSTLAAIKAVKAKLISANVASGRVYTKAPQETAYPFVLMGISSEPLETIKKTYFSHRVRIQAWSQISLKEAIDIRIAVYNALHRQTLTVDSPFIFSSCNVATLIDALLESDGKTFQSIIEFDIVLTN